MNNNIQTDAMFLQNLIDKINEQLSTINNRLDTIERRLLVVETKNNISSLIEIAPRTISNLPLI